MSVTQFHAGTANNVIPATAQLIISIRTFSAAVQDLVEKRLGELADGVGRMYGAEIELEYARGVPPTVNDTAEADFAADIRSEEHTSELQSLMRNSYAVFCLKKKKPIKRQK